LADAKARHGKAPQTVRPVRRGKDSDNEILGGRNSVLEALRTGVPATTLYIAARVEFDDRVKEALSLAAKRGIAVLEIMRPEMDRLCGEGNVHQGIALAVPPYEYKHPLELLDYIEGRGENPLFVALDGITDPRNLGAIIRSAAAFGAQGIIVPQRRSVGVTAAAWKTSAGAAARLPVAMASNLNQTIKAFKNRGIFVVGLDGDGDSSLPKFALADRPLLVVVGSEGKGLSRLVTENCDAIVSIPIGAATESLNAGIATSISLYEIAMLRGGKRRS
jgi:23S rRNA (guanosine2251-2'-O)-methyltransferase